MDEPKQIILLATPVMTQERYSQLTGLTEGQVRGQIEKGTAPKTCNNDLGYLNAVFNELHRTGETSYQNPFRNIRPIKIQEREMGYLDVEQIETIFAELREKTTNPHALLVARLSLETGVRWSEAESLTLNRLKPHRVTYD